MCASDISVLVWRWNEHTKQAELRTDVVHACRNFDKIVEWAKMNKARTEFDADVFIQDDGLASEI